jgi:hypothetical protein
MLRHVVRTVSCRYANPAALRRPSLIGRRAAAAGNRGSGRCQLYNGQCHRMRDYIILQRCGRQRHGSACRFRSTGAAAKRRQPGGDGPPRRAPFRPHRHDADSVVQCGQCQVRTEPPLPASTSKARVRAAHSTRSSQTLASPRAVELPAGRSASSSNPVEYIASTARRRNDSGTWVRRAVRAVMAPGDARYGAHGIGGGVADRRVACRWFRRAGGPGTSARIHARNRS